MKQLGGVLIRLEEDRRAAVEESIAARAGFTDALNVADWPTDSLEVCGLLFEEDVVLYWALANRGPRVATGKVRVGFTRVTPTRIGLSQFSAIASFQFHDLGSSAGVVRRISPADWLRFKEALRSIDIESFTKLEELETLRDRGESTSDLPGAGTLAQERDATGLVLSIFDGTGDLRRDTLSRWSATPRLRSFLDGLEGVHAIEDHHIAFDSTAFPEAQEIRPTIVGSVFSVGGRTLEVFNVNRTAIETTLGVDLLYFHEEFDAWTMVQYKVMEDRLRGAAFRIDNQFEQDLERMASFRTQFPDSWGVTEGSRRYRLCADGFYFKFCPRVQLNVFSSSLLSGMYLPRLHIESLLADGSLNGPTGGKVITFENTARHLTNTTFATLAREAWIGTRGLSSQEVGRLVAGGLDAKRSVILGRARRVGTTADLAETVTQLGL